ncbi:uncharacterized protein BYT42DRAFT_326631 [Radiomyces spectabilis]|uniref:uncharacterized protein n=1 Tax=Radiomyces spectabilis TaxID=64574 RepID=UPI002220C109|nr:uncharacterized protein BYT42DRAFT_326631 [Radiomyces spectabilis]KAI8379431.1 hypothetical protein BYT42DRAFT_326631 [Radiomyces spectabilis]
MKAHICVDYLSYDWTAPELVRAHREIHCQMAATTMKRKLSQSVPPINTRTKQNKLVRLQNALWRQMARTCTPHLSKDNPMVDPSVVNWQKESDITWLFGPLFSDDPPPSTRNRISENITKTLHQKKHYGLFCGI